VGLGEAKEECGIAAVHLRKELKHYPQGGAAHYLCKMLLQQQNRGQLSAGITTYNAQRQQIIDTYADLGTVYEAFRISHPAKHKSIMERYSGAKGIGHVRYATSGCDDKSYAQPFERHHGRKWKWFAFAFNGNLANYSELKQKLIADDYHLVRDTDTEVMMHLISKALVGDKRPDIENVFSSLSGQFDGAYNIVFIDAEGNLIIARDPIGFKPLCYGSDENIMLAASESAALSNLDVNKIEFPEPGEMLIAGNGNIEKKRFAHCKRKAHCMFEWVYFANVSSIIDSKSVYEARWNLGKELAKLETEKASSEHVIVPVPDTSKPVADALSYELGIPAKEGLIRNRYVGRTFIESSDRLEKVKDKFTLNRPVISGKKVILVEDSIVRGTTIKTLVQYIKKSGNAKEVHVRVSCPPIKYPCFYGIDMSTLSELIAPRHMKASITEQYSGVSEKISEGIAKEIGADSLIYQTYDGLARAIGFEDGAKSLCTACLNADYPTEWGHKLLEKAQQNFEKHREKRTYE